MGISTGGSRDCYRSCCLLQSYALFEFPLHISPLFLLFFFVCVITLFYKCSACYETPPGLVQIRCAPIFHCPLRPQLPIPTEPGQPRGLKQTIKLRFRAPAPLTFLSNTHPQLVKIRISQEYEKKGQGNPSGFWPCVLFVLHRCSPLSV